MFVSRFPLLFVSSLASVFGKSASFTSKSSQSCGYIYIYTAAKNSCCCFLHTDEVIKVQPSARTTQSRSACTSVREEVRAFVAQFTARVADLTAAIRDSMRLARQLFSSNSLFCFPFRKQNLRAFHSSLVKMVQIAIDG